MKKAHEPSALRETGEDIASRLDALLAYASNPEPAPGFSDRVLAALHEADARDEEWAKLISTSRPYARLKHWSAGVAACAALSLAVVGIMQHMAPPAPSMQEQAVSIAGEVLLEEALDTISDTELLSAIYSVSNGTYSVSSSISDGSF